MALNKEVLTLFSAGFLYCLITFLVYYYFFIYNPVPTFHILIATAGRTAIRRLLDSLREELNAGDAITIVFDGDKGKEKSALIPEWFMGHKSHINIIEQVPNLGFWGHGIRNKYQRVLDPKCTFVLHADDDDTYLKGSFAKLRKLCTNPNTFYISKMVRIFKNTEKPDKIVPSLNQKVVTFGDIGTPNGIVPTSISAKGIWGNFYGGDFHYYNSVKDYAENVVFLDEVIYKVFVDE
jgi:hypothetical protein